MKDSERTRQIFMERKVKKTCLKIGTIFILVAILIAASCLTGCMGTESDARTRNDMDTEIVTRLQEHEKRIEGIEKTITATAGEDLSIQDIRSEIRQTKKEINNVEKRVTHNIQKQVTKSSNSTLYVIGVLFVVMAFSLLKDFIRAWRESGGTLKNFIGLIT